MERNYRFEFVYDEKIKATKGLAIYPKNEIIVNLASNKFKLNKIIDEILAKEVTKTIVHEYLHLAIQNITGKLYKFEETIIQAICNQVKIEKFKYLNVL